MTQRTSDKLAFAGKLLLVAAGIAAVAASVVMIILNARESHAQSKAETLSFEVASIKASCPEPRPTRRSGAPDRCSSTTKSTAHPGEAGITWLASGRLTFAAERCLNALDETEAKNA
jgi:hypothetical protein